MIGGQPGPIPSPIISPNIFNTNFEIVILLSIFERSNNYVFEDDTPLAALRVRTISYISYSMLIFMVVYAKVSCINVGSGLFIKQFVVTNCSKE